MREFNSQNPDKGTTIIDINANTITNPSDQSEVQSALVAQNHKEIDPDIDDLRQIQKTKGFFAIVLNSLKKIVSTLRRFYQKHKTPIRITLSLFVILGIVGASIVSLWVINIWNNESSLGDLGKEPEQSSVVYASDGTTELFRFYSEENREVVPLDKISPNMQQAIIALEDENFYYNENGIPWSNLAGALIKCGTTVGKECRGASGLSQQLIKNVKNDDESTVDRKMRELLTAVKLNNETTKEEILSLYLNWVPFGRNAYGVEQASKQYFGISSSDLSLPQSCYLASMVQRPSYFSSSLTKPDSIAFQTLEGRKNACLEKIYSKQLDPNSEKPIKSEEELKTLQETKVEFIPRGGNTKYPHFKDYVTEQINKFVSEDELLTGGYKIITTIDPSTQEAVEKSLQNRKQTDIINLGANNASVVVLDGPTSEIRAMVGSLDYQNKEIDGEVNVALAPRQPGSSIKPYVYASSFKQGLYPGSILLDIPTTFDSNYRPKNFSGGFSGPISIRDSLANSYNIPAVKAAYLSSSSPTPNPSQGISNVFDTATAMGLEFSCIPSADGSICDTDDAQNAYKKRCGISASLGGCEVSLLSHVNGINTFAQDGSYKQATPFKQIIDSKGTDIYTLRQTSNNPVYKSNTQALDPLIARQINSIMSDYQARYRAFGNSAKRLELEGWTGANAVAAKTGTTNDVKDTWTVGYSPYYSVAVWVGNTDGKPLLQSSGSVATSSGIWNDTMVHLHANKEKKGFSKDGLKAIKINGETGLPDENGNKTEYITPSQLDKLNKSLENIKKIPEYKPLENNFLVNLTTNFAVKVPINKLDGKAAVPNKTLEVNIEQKDFRFLVAEYSQWQVFANEWMQKTPDKFTPYPTELSDQDQVADQASPPLITSNLDTNKEDVSFITISVTPQGQTGKTITKISLLIDGKEVATSNSDTLMFDSISPYTSGTYSVLIKSEDSFGSKSEKVYVDVKFKEATLTLLSVSDISDLKLECTEDSNSIVNCEFSIPASKSLPDNFSIRIGNSGNAPCSMSANKGVCTNVTAPSISGTYTIRARIGTSGSYNDTDSEYVVS